MSEKKFKTFADLKLVPPKSEETPPTIAPIDSVTAQPQSSESSSETASTHPIAPIKDFHKVANSVNREALAGGLFKTGAYKKIYDALYLLTRGAINPTRTISIKKTDLMKRCSIGSRVTIDNGVEHLQKVGLIDYQVVQGSHSGNLFEVFLPEEIKESSLSSLSSLSSQTRPVYFLDRLDRLESRQTRQALINENKGTYSDAKTFIKTEEKNDDEKEIAQLALRGFAEKIGEIFAEISGKNINETDAANLTLLGEILAAELRARQKFTKNISKPSAFLAQHIKLLCLQTPAEKKSQKKSQNTPDLVGKNSEAPIFDLSNLPADLDPNDYPEYCFSCGWLHEECCCQKNRSEEGNG